MAWFSRLLSTWRNWRRGDRLERDLDDEIRGYAEMLADEKTGRGVPAAVARREAFAEVGGIEPVKEAVRDVRAGAVVESLWRDVRFGVRLLRQSPGFTLAAVASLGLGIGFNTSIFAVLDVLLLRPLPAVEPHRLVDIYTSGTDGDTYATSSLPDLIDFRAQTRAQVFEDVAGYTPVFTPLTTSTGEGDRVRLAMGEQVTGNYFTMLGVKARLGRTLMPADDIRNAPRHVVISEQLWQREFGGDPSVLGRNVRLRGEPYAIVGVIEEAFTGMMPMLAPELWVTTARVEDVESAGINDTVPSPGATARQDRRGTRWLFAKARLKPGVTIEQARASMQVAAARLAREYPATNKDRRVTVRAASATRVHPEADGMLAVLVSGCMAAVGLVLMIACANVAGMLLARGAARAREVSIRLALGAGRVRLVQQLLIESLLLAAAGAALGIGLAWWLMRMLTTIELPFPVPLSLDLRLDARVLAFTVVASIVTAIVAGLMPALKSTRPDLVSTLRGERPIGRGAWRGWTMRDFLVIGQMAVTTVLLIVAGLLMRSLSAAKYANVGFGTQGVATVSADLDMLRYSDERSRQFFDDALRRVRALPGVQAAAIATRLPFSLNFNQMNIAVAGYQTADQMGPGVLSAQVSPEYFETLRIPLLQGRVFTAADTTETPRVVVINQTMARRYWPAGNAIGQRVFERTLAGKPFEVVGVVADHKLRTIGEKPVPAMFHAAAQRPSSFYNIVARRPGDEQALVAEMRQAMLAIEPNLLLFETHTMREHMSVMLLPTTAGATLVMVFCGLGLLLAAIGLYGVIAFSVARRTREIGIRIAIGARPRAVLAGVMRQGLTLAVLGLAAGFMASARAIRSSGARRRWCCSPSRRSPT
jgi:macrolide transport system ATP-binding/permease protein